MLNRGSPLNRKGQMVHILIKAKPCEVESAELPHLPYALRNRPMPNINTYVAAIMPSPIVASARKDGSNCEVTRTEARATRRGKTSVISRILGVTTAYETAATGQRMSATPTGGVLFVVVFASLPPSDWRDLPDGIPNFLHRMATATLECRSLTAIARSKSVPRCAPFV